LLALHWGDAQDPQIFAHPRGSTVHGWPTDKDQCLPPDGTSEGPGFGLGRARID